MVLLLLLFLLIAVWPISALLCLGVLRLCGVRFRPGSPRKKLLIFFSPFILIGLLTLWSQLTSPVRPDQKDVIGVYEIDRSFYPGSNADWQHATYELEINQDTATIRDSRTDTVWSHPIEWPRAGRWRFKEPWQQRHHMLVDGPALYRKTFHHYYTFKSPLYGTVKFRKKSQGFWKWPLAFIVLVLIASQLWPEHRLFKWMQISRFRSRPPSL